MLQYPVHDGARPRAGRHRRVGLAVTAIVTALLALAAVATAAIIQLPPNDQVNNDPTAGISPTKAAGASDVVGGSLVAGGVNVPWAAFEQAPATGPGQEIFVRSFKGGAWKTQGGSLNIDPTKEAEAPSIDFAGAGRTVPWAAWYEPNAHLTAGVTQIFASRFISASNTWQPEGGDRTATNHVPSLNIHTDHNAEDPSVAGGAGTAGANPVPWVAWQEEDGSGTLTNQIFVSRGTNADPTCTGDLPAQNHSVSNFCWQQVGIPRLQSSTTLDPSLDVDPSRDGVEPDIAFTGPSDTVPWTVWYEQGTSHNGLRSNEQVFAAKAVSDAGGGGATGDGGFHWVAVGSGTAGLSEPLNATLNGGCGANTATEDKCSLNAVATNDAEDPRVATGTLTPGGTTVPWVVWSEKLGAGNTGHTGIFVSRLVGGDHFALFGTEPISNPQNDASTPDITFEGNVPYVTWNEEISGKQVAFSGHFEGGAANPVFVDDTPGGVSGNVLAQRNPISSGCTANPFTADGAACPGGAAGSPFFLRTTDETTPRLLAHGYTPDAAVTGAASAVTQTTATVAGTIGTGGGPVNAHIEYGTTTQYGNVTPDQRLDASQTGQSVSVALSGLPAGTSIHYRLVVSGDFGTVVGGDATFTTLPVLVPGPPLGNGNGNNGNGNGKAKDATPKIGSGALHISSHRVVAVTLTCPAGGARCTGTVKLVVSGHTLASASYSIAAHHHKTIDLHLSKTHAKTFRHAHRAEIEVHGGHRTVEIASSRH